MGITHVCDVRKKKKKFLNKDECVWGQERRTTNVVVKGSFSMIPNGVATRHCGTLYSLPSYISFGTL